jgi:hypothetical protein
MTIKIKWGLNMFDNQDHTMIIEVDDDADDNTIHDYAQAEVDDWVNNNIYGHVDSWEKL